MPLPRNHQSHRQLSYASYFHNEPLLDYNELGSAFTSIKSDVFENPVQRRSTLKFRFLNNFIATLFFTRKLHECMPSTLYTT